MFFRCCVRRGIIQKLETLLSFYILYIFVILLPILDPCAAGTPAARHIRARTSVHFHHISRCPIPPILGTGSFALPFWQNPAIFPSGRLMGEYLANPARAERQQP